MPITFKNSPIVELIAEVRWDTQFQPLPVPAMPGGPTGIVIDQAAQEAFFLKFSNLVFQSGFQQQERLTPAGFPIFAQQPALRFRSTNKPHVLYQVGAGFFSANAITPYKTWNDFSPAIEEGLQILFQARADAEKNLPLSSIGLRYLDSFTPELTQVKDISSFISEILKIQINLPEGISKNLAKGETYKPSLQLQIPIKEGMMMHLAIGEGTVNKTTSFVMDTNVVSTTKTDANVGQVMASMNSAHDVIHNMFFSLTEPLYDRMGPSEEN